VLREPGEIATRIGSGLFALFIKCFAGVDRLLSVEQFFILIRAHVHEDSPAYKRNLNTIFFLAVSALQELGSALQALSKAEVSGKMKDPSVWQALIELRGRWNTHWYSPELSNQGAQHVGDNDIYQKGLANLLAERELRLLHGSDDRKHSAQFVLPLDALLRGLKVDHAQLVAVMDETVKAHITLFPRLVAVFREVLDTAGVAFEDRRT
jgi:hypothetical protein